MPLPHSAQVYVQSDASSAHDRRILEGICDYAHSLSQPWTVRWGPLLPPASVLTREEFKGLIVFNPSPKRMAELRRSQTPFVRVSSHAPTDGVNQVTPDNRVIGRIAANHFLTRYFTEFAFVGCEEHYYSREREAGFQQGIGKRRLRSFSCDCRADHLLPEFLQDLPVQTAIFAANDVFARRVAEVLKRLALRIPEDRSLIGVDNDPLMSMTTSVALSSIDPASAEIGRRAAAMLSGLMAGGPGNGGTEKIPPAGVVLRTSSDLLATQDEVINRAVHIIRQESCKGLNTDSLCRRLGIGRRAFERRFRTVLKQGPEAEMRRVRIAHAMHLLTSTSHSITSVAEQAGFADPFYFSSAFRKATGLSPRAWRNTKKTDTHRTL